MKHWYISFATPERFLGGTVVAAVDAAAALAEATKLGRNPGGEAAILPVPPDALAGPDCQAMLNRLLGEDELLALGAAKRQDCEEEVRALFDWLAHTVCQE